MVSVSVVVGVMIVAPIIVDHGAAVTVRDAVGEGNLRGASMGAATATSHGRVKRPSH